MLVPATLARSTSPSPGNAPPVIATVALARVALSGSETATVGDSVTAGPFSVKDASVVPASVGGSFTAVMLIVVVDTELRLLEPLPSLSSQVTVRVGRARDLVVVALAVTNATLRSTCW